MNIDMWTYLACIVLCMTTWRKKIRLYKIMTKSYLNDITLPLSIITQLDSTVVTKIWASDMDKDCYILHVLTRLVCVNGNCVLASSSTHKL